MKIHYKKPNLLDEMKQAIATSKEPSDHFELSTEEFNQYYTFFDKAFLRDNSVQYMFRSIPIKVNHEQN